MGQVHTPRALGPFLGHCVHTCRHLRGPARDGVGREPDARGPAREEGLRFAHHSRGVVIRYIIELVPHDPNLWADDIGSRRAQWASPRVVPREEVRPDNVRYVHADLRDDWHDQGEPQVFDIYVHDFKGECDFGGSGCVVQILVLFGASDDE